jgi:hydroxymethylglutaryl-CoA lyase
VSDLPDAAQLREVGPRDGLQNEQPVRTDEKVQLIDALSGTGLRRIEAVSFVHPQAVPQMADAEEVWRRIDHRPGVCYSALVPNRRGAARARTAGVRQLEVVVSASDTHNRHNVRRSTADSLDDIAALIEDSHAAGAEVQVVVSTAFGCPYEGEVPVRRVVEVARRAVADGADGISFGDTTGVATPTRVEAVVGEFRAACPNVRVNLHFHDTRGTALANVLRALQLGVSDFDAAVGGLGGCPYAPGASGNVATEGVVHMLEDMGVATGVDLAALLAVARQAERMVGRELPSAVLRAGPRTQTVATRSLGD